MILDNNKEYGELWKQQIMNLHRDGYNFINSNACSEILDNIREIEEAVLSETKNAKLFHEFKTEKELHDKRETVMLNNIYNYSKQHPYEQALFICGVEHRKPLKKKIKEYESKEELKLNWKFYNEV